MSLIEAIILGLIQGITEFLPVSSSGHLTLMGKIIEADETAMLSLTTWLHLGTLIAVFVVMRREIVDILKNLKGLTVRLIILATIPAVLMALLLGDWLDSLFGGGFLGVSFLLTGIAMLVAALMLSRQRKTRPIGYREALSAGLGQAIAILPGVSRSGLTVTAMLLTDVEREQAIRFSFLMSIPAILGGLALDLLDVIQGEGAALLSFGAGNLIAGVLAAAVSGWLAMEFMIRHLNRRGFLICAIYVIVLGGLVILDQTVTHLVF